MRITLNTALAVLAVGLLAPAIARGEQKIQVEVDAPFEPRASIGLILSPDTTIEKPVNDIKSTKLGTKMVSVPYAESEVGPSSVATALLISEDGQIAVGNVRPLFKGAASEDLMLPICKDSAANSSTLTIEQHGVLQTLIEYRTTRRKLTRLKVVRAMEGEALEKLNKLEERLGLSRSEPLGPNLNPVALVDRLSRIAEALRAAKAAREEKLPKVELPQLEEPEAFPSTPEPTPGEPDLQPDDVEVDVGQ